MSRLKNYLMLALLTNITDETVLDITNDSKISRTSVPQLKMFGHPRNRPTLINCYGVTVFKIF